MSDQKLICKVIKLLRNNTTTYHARYIIKRIDKILFDDLVDEGFFEEEK